jgi:predicted CXXCH cytochrome family protein
LHARIVLPLLILVAGGRLGAAGPKPHPPFDDASVACGTCHAGLTGGKKVVHAAMDCRSCHAVLRSGAGISIALSEPEPKVCLKCHQGLTAAATGSLKFSHSPVKASCTAVCHVPHAGDVPKLLRASQAALCGTCHEAARLETRHGGGGGLTAATRCAACHAPHGGTVAGLLRGRHVHAPVAKGSCNSCHRGGAGRLSLRTRGGKLCMGCHASLDGTKEDVSVHAALKDGPDGRAGCLSCHDPHVSPEPALLLVPAGNACAGCHQNLVDAGKAEPGCLLQRDRCEICHTSHSSDRPALLSIVPSRVCAACHSPKKASLVKKHLGADLEKLDCLSCHSTHGDCQPKSLARVVHPPVLDGCDSCHEGGEAGKLVSGGGADLCEACHDPVLEAARKFTVRHAAMDAGSCRSCHSPHAANRRWLMKSPPGSTCAPCHAAQVAGPGESAHGVIQLLGCEVCHEPHGSNSKKLLRRTGSDLCLACHGAPAAGRARGTPMKVFARFEISAAAAAAIRILPLSNGGTRDHPVHNHRTLGTPTAEELKTGKTRFTGELTCLSCHDPHKGATRTLLVGGATGAIESCRRCHPV